MIGERCPVSHRAAPTYSIMKKLGKEVWCSALLPCGACAKERRYTCNQVVREEEFNCDECEYRFICLTIDNRYDLLEEVEKHIIRKE